MDEQKLEELIRGVVRDEMERGLYDRSSDIVAQAREDFAYSVADQLERLVVRKVAEASVETSADAIGHAAAKRLEEFCTKMLVPIFANTVRETLHPYIAHVDRLVRSYESEEDWWKHGSGDGEAPPQPPSKKQTPVPDLPRSLDTEMVRAVVQEELDRSTEYIIHGVMRQLFNEIGFLAEEVIEIVKNVQRHERTVQPTSKRHVPPHDGDGGPEDIPF